MESKTIMALPEFLAAAADLPKETKSKLFRVLRQLAVDYRHPGLQTKKIQGTKVDIFECRVDQSTRLIYDLSERKLRCWYVGSHDAAIRFGVRVGDSLRDHVDD